MVESYTIHITESRRFALPPEFVLLVHGSGVLTADRLDNASRIKLRAQPQALGPFLDVAGVTLEATGDVTWSLYDLQNLDESDLALLTTLLPGTRAWVIDAGGRTERYWDGAAWVPNAWFDVSSDAPDDGDGRPNGFVRFQVGA